MNAWMVAALVLTVGGLVPAGLRCLRGDTGDRVIGLQLASTVGTLVLLLFAQASGRSIYFDLAVTLAVLSFASGLVFIRFLERWL